MREKCLFGLNDHICLTILFIANNIMQEVKYLRMVKNREDNRLRNR